MRIVCGSTDHLVREFHEAFGLQVEDSVGPIDPDVARARLRLIREEYEEVLADARQVIAFKGVAQQEAVTRLAKELADLRYVIDGCALTFGINMPAVVREVHRSNMSKLGEDGLPIKREDGKVVKGPNYSEADIASVLDLPIDGTEAT